VEAALERYRVAYGQKDIAGINHVFPEATVKGTFSTAFKQCAGVELTFTSKNTKLLSDSVAQVETTSIYACTPSTKQRRQDSPPVADIFQLEKRGTEWVITEQLIPRKK